MTMKTQNQNYKRGNVILVLFPHSDLRTAKTRPALIVQADDLGTDLSQYIVSMISSKMFRADHPSRVAVRLSEIESQQSGLLSDSVVMCDNLATIAASEIDRVIGNLPMNEINKALKHTLALK